MIPRDPKVALLEFLCGKISAVRQIWHKHRISNA